MMKMTCAGCGREMRSANRPHGFLLHAIWKVAKRAYQEEIIVPQMEMHVIGPGKEYADKDDWMSHWFLGIIEE